VCEQQVVINNVFSLNGFLLIIDNYLILIDITFRLNVSP